MTQISFVSIWVFQIKGEIGTKNFNSEPHQASSTYLCLVHLWLHRISLTGKYSPQLSKTLVTTDSVQCFVLTLPHPNNSTYNHDSTPSVSHHLDIFLENHCENLESSYSEVDFPFSTYP